MPGPTAESPRDAALFDEVRDLLRRGAIRLRRRHMVRGAIVGGWAGGVVALALAGLSRLWWHLPVEPAWVVAGVVPLAAGVGALIDGARVGLRPREVALLLDRTLGTDELLVTALHLEKAPPSWSQAAVNARLRQRLDARPPLAHAVPLRVPRRTAWLGLVLATAAALLWVPQRPGARGEPEPESTLAEEASRLEERLDRLDEEFQVELPEEIEDDLAELVEQLRSGDLDEPDARERIADLQEQVQALQDELEPSRKALEDIGAAAQALQQDEATRDLGDALAQMDPEEAAEAARDLADRLSAMTPEERQQAGEALKEAGERLRESEDESLREAGERMERTGSSLAGDGEQGAGEQGGEQQGAGEQGGEQQGADGQQQGGDQQGDGQQGGEQQGGEQGGEQQGGEQGGEQQGGEQGSQQQGTSGQGSDGSQGGQGASDLQRLADELERQQSLAERLQQDGEKLARSQQVNGALEGSDQRLGGESSVAEGESSGEAGEPGESGHGECKDCVAGGADYGTGHTWEDQGSSADPTAGHHDADRQSDRTGGKELDDFQRLYDPVRLEGAEGLLTGVDGTIDDEGRVEVLPTTLTGAHQDASTPLVTLPPGYREAADEALSGERVPAGYREAVKQYFDGME